MQRCASLYLRKLSVKQANTRTQTLRTYYRYHTLIWKGLVTEHSVPMHHAFGMSSLTTSRLLRVCKTSRSSWKHCYFERSLFNYMDHDNCPLTSFKALLNIIGGKGAISIIIIIIWQEVALGTEWSRVLSLTTLCFSLSPRIESG